MVGTEMLEILQKLVGAEQVWEQEPMKNHTTFRVGGPARYLVEPGSAGELIKVIGACLEAGDAVSAQARLTNSGEVLHFALYLETRH